MKKYYFSKKTDSAYLAVYTTKTNPALPSNGEDWVVLECRMKDKFWRHGDQHLVTIPIELLNDYFSKDAGKPVLKSHLIGEED